MYKRIVIADYYQQKNNNQNFFDKQLTSHDHCNVPWQTLIINRNGECYICLSPAWLPISIGSILDYDNLFDLLNSPTAIEIRQSILDNRYTYCNDKLCGMFLNSQKNRAVSSFINYSNAMVSARPKHVVFDFDETCNYKCPSCRTSLINYNTGPRAEINQKVVDQIKKVVLDAYRNFPHDRTFRWAGGEPFISKSYLELWEYVLTLNSPNIKHYIQTNGSYLIKKKDLFVAMLPQLGSLRISIDAGTKETYEKIRVNGVWENLLENCRFAAEQVKDFPDINFSSDLIVQEHNYREIPEFINVSKDIGFRKMIISKMWNWGTWTNETFTEYNVSDSGHPNYQEFLNIIRPFKDDPQVDISFWKNDLT